MVQAWYQGGISVFDFTDPKNPRRSPSSIAVRWTRTAWAVADRGPPTGTTALSSAPKFPVGSTSSSWTPSEHLTQNEIDAAKAVRLAYFNPQMQPRFVWPATAAVARAYLDQLARSNGLDAARIAAARQALTSAERVGGTAQDVLAQLATQLEGDATGAGDAAKVRMLAGAEAAGDGPGCPGALTDGTRNGTASAEAVPLRFSPYKHLIAARPELRVVKGHPRSPGTPLG